MGMTDINGARIKQLATSDFLKTLNDKLLGASMYTLCVPRLLKPAIECVGMNKCKECIEKFVNQKYEGGF